MVLTYFYLPALNLNLKNINCIKKSKKFYSWKNNFIKIDKPKPIIISDISVSIPLTKTNDPEEVKRSFNVTLGIMPDYLFDGKGLKIDGVKENRPGSNGGLLKGDVIVKMKNETISSMDDYMKAPNVFNPGDMIEVIIERDGVKMIKKVKF